MKENNELNWSQEELEYFMSVGKVPKRHGEFDINKLAKSIKKIADIQKNNNNKESEKWHEFHKFVLDNKDILTKAVEEKKRGEKFRQSGHLIDQTLKYNKPKTNCIQLTLFDLINSETKEKIEASNIEITAEGIRLTPAEDKMIKAINKLLYEKSENIDVNSEAFYLGNDPSNQLSHYGGKGQTSKTALLRIFPSELYKAYLDRSDYSSHEIKFIKKTLFDLCNKKFLIIYDRKRIANGKTVTDRIEDFQSLIKIVSFFEGLTSQEMDKLDDIDHKVRNKRGELIIGLNPIFTDQINTKYIEYPTDINKRTTIAAGGHLFLTESMVVLRDYMLRAMSTRNFRVEINEDTLPYILRLENYLKNRKKKIVLERINDAINTIKNLGIIIDVQKVIGARGQLKYVFILNESFE